ncbi:hypothetical protein C2E23DRAFT_741908 [Lenzites betulinus]|nr:hypothetical protein C2E23DRAFT_741908 [Lenzites betulinus]
MANRRETGDKAGGRGGRGSNKENKLASKGSEVEKDTGHQSDRSVRRTVSLELSAVKASAHASVAGPSHAQGTSTPSSPVAPILADAPVLSAPALRQELYGVLSRTDPTENFDDSFFQSWHHKSLLNSADDGFFFRSTPPQTPGLSPSKSSASKVAIPPESPYDPTRTPAFRHSPARLPSDQPWRATASMSDAARQLTLGMLVRGEASPNVRGLDVSPIVLQPASERKKRSVFSPPSVHTPGSMKKFPMLNIHDDLESDMLFPSPRRLFADTDRPNHTPSIFSRMGDFAWPSPMKDFPSPGPSSTSLAVEANLPTPVGEPEDPFKAYLHLSPLPKAGGDSSPAHPPSSSGSDGSVSRQRREGLVTIPDLGSPTPSFGPPRTSLTSLSKLRWRVDEEDVDMDVVEETGSLMRKSGMAKLGLGTPLRVQDQVHRRGDSSSSLEVGSSEGSGVASSGSKAPLSSGSATSSHSRRGSSPFRFGSHGRQRSASGSSSSHKAVATAGLMDKILGRQEKPQRRRTSHTHDNDIAVDAMGSPFKVGRKISRNDFMYSVDGDCEMQEVPTKKRRKTINGRD